jgi:hypothetical protein
MLVLGKPLQGQFASHGEFQTHTNAAGFAKPEEHGEAARCSAFRAHGVSGGSDASSGFEGKQFAFPQPLKQRRALGVGALTYHVCPPRRVGKSERKRPTTGSKNSISKVRSYDCLLCSE